MDFLNRSEQERTRLRTERENERKKKLRNTQWAAGILGVLAVIAILAALVALKEKRHAENSLRMAKNAVDESLSSAGREQARAGADSPQMEEFRKELLDKAQTFYAVLSQQNSTNEELRSETAAAHSRLGDINRLLQKYDESAREYKLAIKQFEALKSEHPESPQYARALAYAHNWIGETYRLWWETAPQAAADGRVEAEKHYDAALALQQQLHVKAPTDVTAQQELARTNYNRGIVRYDGKNLQGAEEDFRTGITLLDPLAQKSVASADASAPKPSQDLARAYNNLANLLSNSNPKEAAHLYVKAVETATNLVKSGRTIANTRWSWRNTVTTTPNFSLLRVISPTAHEKNRRAIAIIESLATPSQSLFMGLVPALQFRIKISGRQEQRRGEARIRPAV